MGRAGTEIDGQSRCAMKARWCGNKTVREHVWMMCLGVSLQQATKSGSKCDSLLTVWGKQRSQLPAGLDTGTAASGTPGINDIGVLSWFKPSTCAKEAPAGVTKCNWGYWSMTQLPTLGVSLTLLRLGGYWEPMAPAPHFPPKGSARAGTSRELPKCTAWSVLTFQYLHVPISDSNPVGTIMSLCQHISPTPSPCSSFPSDYFQVLWDCFQWISLLVLHANPESIVLPNIPSP